MAVSDNPHEACDSEHCTHPSFTYARKLFTCVACGKEFEPWQMKELEAPSNNR